MYLKTVSIWTGKEWGEMDFDSIEAAYHRNRAMRELDLGFQARSIAACHAHLTLSALHMKRADALTPRPAPQPFILAQCA